MGVVSSECKEFIVSPHALPSFISYAHYSLAPRKCGSNFMWFQNICCTLKSWVILINQYWFRELFGAEQRRQAITSSNADPGIKIPQWVKLQMAVNSTSLTRCLLVLTTIQCACACQESITCRPDTLCELVMTIYWGSPYSTRHGSWGSGTAGESALHSNIVII